MFGRRLFCARAPRVTLASMDLTRAEIDAMLRRADEARTKLRRATRELKQFGEEALAAREAGRAAGPDDVARASERPSDAVRSR